VLARVYVTPKRGILDPQGKAVQHSLHALGFAEVSDVKVGKYIELQLRDAGREGREPRGCARCASACSRTASSRTSASSSTRTGADALGRRHVPRLARRPGRAARGSEHPVTTRSRSGTRIAISAASMAVILPGGFSYGDYLRCGAMAGCAPIMGAGRGARTRRRARARDLQRLPDPLRGGLLPGALVRNRSLSFVCEPVTVRIEAVDTAFTHLCQPGEVLTLPIKHGEGCYVADESTLATLERERRVVFRYVGSNPNGSLADIAGVCNAGRNVVGLMPHPEHAAERLTGGEDGLKLFRSAAAWLERRGAERIASTS
jgi:phosphoribosylformylglycinamidine synthase